MSDATTRLPSALALVPGQIVAATKVTVREPSTLFFTVAFPVAFYVAFSLIGIDVPGGGFAQFFAPGMITFGVVSSSFSGLAIGAVFAREAGVLKRWRGTPLPPSSLMAGRVGASGAAALLGIVVVLGYAVVVQGLVLEARAVPALVVVLVLGTVAFSALGLAVTAIIPTGNAAVAVTNAIVFPLNFVSGIFYPIDGLPGWLQVVAESLPVYPLAHALRVAVDPATTGLGLAWPQLAVVTAWGVAGGLLALRFFRWEAKGEQASRG